MARGYSLSIGGVPVAPGIDVSIERPENFYQSQARRLVYWVRLNENDLEKREREWVARELGDVPQRVTWIDAIAKTDPELALAFALFQGQERISDPVPDYFGETVPVESLGRNHG